MDNTFFRTIDDLLCNWRQGDCTLGEMFFVHRLDPSQPLSDSAREVADEGLDLVESPVPGFCVLTQRCDIVRSCKMRPFIEVAPLVDVDESTLREIKKSKRPSYAYVPGVADRFLVADLDRVMTVEKAIISQWERIPGCCNDEEARAFALALARKRIRFAFPDEFTEFASKLQKRLVEKHGKHSTEGRALRALHEIRVRAAPAWDEGEVELMFWFIQNDEEPTFEGKSWSDFLEAWLSYIKPSGRFVSVDGAVLSLDDLTGRDYIESDQLDLDHLSLKR